MNAFILAAGFGKRMGDLTKDMPKPMLAINGIRLIDYSLYLAKKWNLSKLLVNVHYKSKVIKQHLQGFPKLNIQIADETEKILGTAGGIRSALPEFEEASLVLMNPDTILLPSPTFELKKEPPPRSLIHLYLAKIPPNETYTKISLGEENRIIFGEGNYYYIGLAILKPKCLEHLKKNEYYDLSDTFKFLSKSGELTGEIFDGQAIDVGTKELFSKLESQSIFGTERDQIDKFLFENLSTISH